MPKSEDNLESSALCLMVSSSTGQVEKEVVGQLGRGTQEDKAQSLLDRTSWLDLPVWKCDWRFEHLQILSLYKHSTLPSEDSEWRALVLDLECMITATNVPVCTLAVCRIFSGHTLLCSVHGNGISFLLPNADGERWQWVVAKKAARSFLRL